MRTLTAVPRLDHTRPSALALTLVGLSVACIAALAVMRITDAPAGAQVAVQLALVLAFAGLAAVDFPAAVAIVLVETATMGASGLWSQFPGGLSGRQVLHAIVLLRALASLLHVWRRTGRLPGGRYAPHALTLAVVLPAVWMPLGLINGNRMADVFGDGNAHLFFAFVLVFVALIADGFGEWVRRWVFIACAINAAVTGVMILATATGVVSLYGELRPIVLDDLVMGGAVGYMPNGAYRLYLASGIYLQVGAALTVWRLMQRPTSPWLWALYGLLLVDIAATYTRGFWFGSALAVVTVLVLGAATLRRPAIIVAGTAAMFVVATGLGALANFSVPAYVLDRSASTLSIGGEDMGFTPTPGPGRPGAPEQPPEGDQAGDGPDVAGEFSNRVRLTQARVLLKHIASSPLVGHGFGSIARDYPYAHIYSYELTYLDLGFKAGIIGLALFLSFPLRLIVDALRVRLARLRPPKVAAGVSKREMAVVVAVVGSILVTSATNPYVLAAFGLMPILAMIAWLEPSGVQHA